MDNVRDTVQRRAEVYLSEQFLKLISDANKNVEQIESHELDLNDLKSYFGEITLVQKKETSND